VLLVTDWMRHAGGAERYVAAVRAGLAAAGDEPALLTSSAGDAAGGTAEFVAWGTEARLAQGALQIANPWAVATARRAVREHAPEVVFVCMFANHLSPAVFRAFDGLPVVYSASDFKAVCPTFAKVLPSGATCEHREGRACLAEGCVGLAHWLRDRPRYRGIRGAVAGAARVLACSEHVRRALAANGIEAEHVPLPVDPPGPGFRRAPAPDPLFVFSGRLARQKGIFGLARAFARLRAEVPKARLRLVGDGPDRAAFERSLGELAVGDAVELVGLRPHEEVERYLADAWAAVAPTRGPEPLGLVALEAIARGLPVVATRNGGFVETVEEGRSGRLVGDGDEEELLAALRAIALRRDFASREIDAGARRRLLDRHAPARHLEKLREVFATAIAGVAVRGCRSASASPTSSCG
jgi:glycosyltransferase involved in cell wall biosynthesis